MDNEMLMQSTWKYLNDYLDAFVQEKIMDDTGLFHFDRPVDYGMARMFEAEEPGCIEKRNVHLDRFNAINNVPHEAVHKDFLEAIAEIKDVVLVDIGTFYSEKMGLWVADKNPGSKIIICNKEVQNLEIFMPGLFNGDMKSGRFQLSKNIEFDENDPVKSINDLFKSNGFHNVEFRHMLVGKPELENVVREAGGRPVVFYSERTPTMPKEMTSRIASVVKDNRNAEMVLLPSINSLIDAYHGDMMMQKIGMNQAHIWNTSTGNPSKDTQKNGKMRLFFAMHLMHLYYALKIAILGNAEVYRASEFNDKHPYYVSTIKPKK